MTNLESFRYPFEAEIANESEGAKIAHRNAFQGILDLNQAVTALKSQLTTTTTTATQTAETVAAAAATQTVVVSSPVIGAVNNQTGVTTYTTQQSDYGSFILLNDASPITITLAGAGSSPGINLPWYTTIVNAGPSTVTLLPSSGTINGNASFVMGPESVATVVYDGTNYWVELSSTSPQDTPAILHEWLSAYNAATGAFTQTQPAIADISGLVAALALLAPLASPALTGTPTAPTAAPGTNTTQIATTAFVESEIADGTVATAKETLNSLAGTGLITLVEGDLLDGTDKVRIAAGSAGSDLGYMEIATADNGTEPIYVRQYTGANDFTVILRSLALLDALGNTQIPGLLTVGDVPVYANNAAAIAGGLVVGNFYRTGADPDPVCVVH